MSIRCRMGIHDDEWYSTLTSTLETDEFGTKLINDGSKEEHHKQCTRCGRVVRYMIRPSFTYVKITEKEQ